MRRIFFVLSVLGLLVTACASISATTEEPAMPAEQATPTLVRGDLTWEQSLLVARLSETLNVPVEDIMVVSTEAVDWPDGCLGIAEEGIACAEVITPGLRIALETDGRQVEYRMNRDGTQVRPATVLMTWKREGGIAGFCDSMIVYLSGEVHVNSCKQGQVSETRLRDALSEAEMEKLDTWLMQYGQLQIDASDPKGVSDRMIVTLEWNGTGSNETLAMSDQQELLDFAQELHQRSSLPLK